MNVLPSRVRAAASRAAAWWRDRNAVSRRRLLAEVTQSRLFSHAPHRRGHQPSWVRTALPNVAFMGGLIAAFLLPVVWVLSRMGVL